METQCSAISERFAGGYLFVGQPAFVTECKFKFITVEKLLGRPYNRTDRGQLHLPNSRQLIGHLLLFELELPIVGKLLPFASATHTIVFTYRLNPPRRTFNKTNDISLHVPTPFGTNLYIDHITRYGHRNKNHYIVIAPQRLPFCRYGNDLKRLYQRIICLFSCHFYCIFVSRKDSNPYLCMKFYDP